MTDLQAYKALPALRASLKQYKLDLLRHFRSELKAARYAPTTERFFRTKISKVRSLRPAELRTWYMSQRVNEISRSPMSELSARCRGRFVRLA